MPLPATGIPDQVDVRGPRFAAWVTTVVLVVVLVVSAFSVLWAGILLGAQTVVFALGAALGPRRSPYGQLFAALVAPRLPAATEKEPAPPLRFAQLVGFLFAVAGTVAFLSGAAVIGSVAAGFAWFAALLNAAFGVCLGCLIYPLAARRRPVSA
jgi:hypothetical protein